MTNPRIKRSVILEAEMVAYNEAKGRVAEFHKIAKLKDGELMGRNRLSAEEERQ